MSRYHNRNKFKNKTSLYENIRKEKGIKSLAQYDTATINYPSVGQMTTLTVINHRWRMGDRFYKLADAYYKDSSFWWVIAQFNKKPTEFGIEYGDLVMIPTPLERVLEMYRGK